NLLARTSAVENVELPLVYTDTPAREQRERAMLALASVESKNLPRSRRKNWWRPFEYEKDFGQCPDRPARPAGQPSTLVAHHAGHYHRRGRGDLHGSRGIRRDRAHSGTDRQHRQQRHHRALRKHHE